MRPRPVFPRAAALLTVIFLAAATLVATTVAAEEPSYRLIVHADNPFDSFSARDVAQFFLKRKERWPHGVDVEPVDQPFGSEVREAMSLAIHGRSSDKIEIYWQRQIFSGERIPPEIVTNDAEVVAFVRERPGAIGYVSAEYLSVDLPKDGVKPLASIVEPKRVHQVNPRYPVGAQRGRIEGTVLLRVTIGTDGRVENVEATKKVGGGLTEAAVEAVRQWRYEPATVDGQPVGWKIDVPVEFHLGR